MFISHPTIDGAAEQKRIGVDAGNGRHNLQGGIELQRWKGTTL